MNYTLKYARVKHGYARIQRDGSLLITIPVSLKNNQTFINKLVSKGQQLMKKYETKQLLNILEGETVRIFGEEIHVSDLGISRVSERSLIKYYKETLSDYAEPLVDHYAQKVGRTHRTLTIKKLRSRRGSCSSDQEIVLNMHLIHLPTQYIKYVIAHEACHLKVKNHSAKFWALVEEVFSEYKNMRKGLKEFVIG